MPWFSSCTCKQPCSCTYALSPTNKCTHTHACTHARTHTHSFWPIKDSWFAIPNNQLFCLLGPNGAGGKVWWMGWGSCLCSAMCQVPCCMQMYSVCCTACCKCVQHWCARPSPLELRSHGCSPQNLHRTFPPTAGKTTTINCLIGALPPTHGDALIYGNSIRSPGGMNKIRCGPRPALFGPSASCTHFHEEEWQTRQHGHGCSAGPS